MTNLSTYSYEKLYYAYKMALEMKAYVATDMKINNISFDFGRKDLAIYNKAIDNIKEEMKKRLEKIAE